jgi:hypothetical protein
MFVERTIFPCLGYLSKLHVLLNVWPLLDQASTTNEMSHALYLFRFICIMDDGLIMAFSLELINSLMAGNRTWNHTRGCYIWHRCEK